MLLWLLCNSTANARLIGHRHSAELVGLLTAVSRGDGLITREKTARLLFTAFARVLSTVRGDAELWQRLRAAPSVLDGCSLYMRSQSLEPITHGPSAAAPPNGFEVAGRQTAAALGILLMTLSRRRMTSSVLLPGLIRVDCWALKSLGPGAPILQLGGVARELLGCLVELRRQRRQRRRPPRHDRVLRRMVAMLCIGLSRQAPREHHAAVAWDKIRPWMIAAFMFVASLVDESQFLCVRVGFAAQTA